VRRRGAVLGATLAIGCLCALPPAARAQSAEESLPGRIELAAGLFSAAQSSFGTRDATETSAAGPRFVLFSTASVLDATAGAAASVGVRLTRALQVDFGASYSVPTLRTTISADAEKATATDATESVKQVMIDGSLIMHLPRWRLGARSVPFVDGGVGYLRQLHTGRTLVDTGQTYHIGGGVKVALLSASRARLKEVGIRAEARALSRSKGITLDGHSHVSPALLISLFVRL
jgi:hypothetical protein